MMSLPMKLHVGRPPRRELLVVAAEADGAEVVGEGVEPDVGDVLGVPRQRNAPVDARAADREVAQAGADQAERLVAAELGHDGAGVGGVPVEQAVAVAREPEEVVLLLELVDGQLVDRAQVAGEQLVVGVVRLAAHAVLAAVVVELDVAGVVAALQQLLTAVRWRGSVVRMKSSLAMSSDSHAAANRGAMPSANSCGANPGGVRGLLDLEAVLVGAGEELDLLAEQAVPAGHGVADDRRVGVPDVRLVVDVVDRRRRVEPGHGPARYGLPQRTTDGRIHDATVTRTPGTRASDEAPAEERR